VNQKETLAVRREALVAQSAAQRNALIENSAPLLRGTATLDRILGPIRRHRFSRRSPSAASHSSARARSSTSPRAR